MKKILVTGKNSYIGNSFEKWVSQWPDEYQVDKISLRDNEWKNLDFGDYDSILHVAGIAHQDTKANQEDLYYRINRDLTIEIAKKAKAEGIKQFIFMSSMIVYGASSKVGENKIITYETKPDPINFYGKSKLEAEEGIKNFQSEHFNIVIVRPPMIYGKESKGNFPKLAKLAQRCLVFPEIENVRSMIHIDNLTEFLKEIIVNEEKGIFFPQNKEYVNTSTLVKKIAEAHGKNVRLTKIFNPFIKMLNNKEVVNKVFGSLIYDESIISNENLDYRVRNFEESINLTEVGENS